MNIGKKDQQIRLTIAVAAISLFFANTVQGAYSYLLLALSIVMFITSMFKVCPIYSIFGINTCKYDANITKK